MGGNLQGKSERSEYELDLWIMDKELTHFGICAPLITSFLVRWGGGRGLVRNINDVLNQK